MRAWRETQNSVRQSEHHVSKNAAVLASLQKLEEAVFGKSDSTPSSIKQTPESSYSTPVSRFTEGEEAEAAYSELEVIGTREDSLVRITAARIGNLVVDFRLPSCVVYQRG